MKSLGATITEYRTKKEFTTKHLASLVKKDDGKAISPQFLHDVEHGRREPSPTVLQGIAAALGLDPAFLSAVAKQPPNAVTLYLKSFPDAGPAVEELFKTAKEKSFTNWDNIRI